MASSAGKLIVEIIATTAQFQSDLGKASAAADQHARKIDQAFAGIKNSIASHLAGAAASIGAAFGATAFVNLIRGTIEAQDHLFQLSKATGVSVEQLGGLGFAASTTGGNLDDMALAFRKFSVNAAAAAAGSEKEAAVFDRLRITLQDLRTLKPDELFIKAADAFASFEEGPNKAALASAAFGRSYQGILPTLDQGGALLRQNIAYFDRFGGVTTETARKAEEFTTEVKKAQLLAGAFGREITAELLGPMRVLIDQFIAAKESGEGFGGITKKLGEFMAETAIETTYLVEGLEHLQRAAKSLGDRLQAIKNLDFSGGFGLAAKGEAEEIEAINKKWADLRIRIRAAQEQAGKPFVGPPEPEGKKRPAPGLPSPDADKTAKKVLEAALRELELYVASEQDLLRQRESFLQIYYQNDELAIEDYFARRASVAQLSLENSRRALDEEEALIRGRIAKAKPTERAEEEKLLADVIGRRSKIEQAASAASVKDFLEQGRALKDFRDKVEELGIAEAESRGDPAAAAARFDFERRQLIERLKLEEAFGSEIVALQARIGLAAIGQLRDRAIAQAQLNRAEADFATIMGGVANAQARIDLAVSTGNATEIEGLNARSALAQRYIAVLQQQADAAQRAAEALSGPEKTAALQGVDQLRLRSEQLAAETDLLAKKFRDVFESDFADALLAAETGAKKFKDVIKDLGKAIEQDLLRIANKNIAEQLFGKGGPLGGVSDFFAGIFGGKGLLGGGAEATKDLALVTNTTSLELNTAAIIANTAALGVSAATSGAGVGFGAFGNIFGGSSFGEFARGTDFAPGGLALVGERGEEVVNLPRGSQVIPNDVLVGRRAGRHTTVNVNISVPGSTTTKSATQIARETGLAVHRALNRS